VRSPIVSAGRFLGMARPYDVMKDTSDLMLLPVISDLFGENLPVMALPEETCRIVARLDLPYTILERLAVVKDADSP